MNIIILAGGRGQRLGKVQKPFLPFGNDTLLNHIIHRLQSLNPSIRIVTKNPELFSHIPVQVFPDEYDAGPLGGIYTGLLNSQSNLNFVMGCDMPFIDIKLIKYMMNQEVKGVLVPRSQGGLEPLHAVYHKNCLQPIRKEIKGGSRKATSFYHKVSVKYLHWEELKAISPGHNSFFNINNDRDYRLAIDIMNKIRDKM